MQMDGRIKYEFAAKLWRYDSAGGWHFVSLPNNLSKEIRDNLKWQEEGWGRLKVSAKIGEIEWKTAIWFDTKLNTYLLPVKADIRRKAKLEVDKTIDVLIWV